MTVTSEMRVETIDDVLGELDEVIRRERQNGSCRAYFAVLYWNVTVKVRDGIQNGRFEDDDLMERFDVIFANRYLDALDRYRAGDMMCRSWRKAFEAANWWSPLIVQHLLLGINAHINFDLGIAAAQACPPGEITSLKADFFEINQILDEMLDDVQRGLADVSPWMGFLDYIGCRTDEQISGFCLTKARDAAWKCARNLSSRDPEEWQSIIDHVDKKTAALAYTILKPTIFGMPLFFAIRFREPDKVGPVVEALR